MAKYTLKDITTPGFQLPADYNELVSVYRTLAKTADQRLVRLEKYAEEPNMGDALNWAYRKAQWDIKQWSGEQANRFNTKPPEKYNSLLAKVKDIQSFIESPSSTKQGIKKVYMERAKSINEKYGTNFNWQNVGDFFESSFYAKLKDEVGGSDTIVEAIGYIQKHPDQIKRAIATMKKEQNTPDAEKTVIKIKNNDVLSDKINQIISKYPEGVLKMLDGKYNELGKE